MNNYLFLNNKTVAVADERMQNETVRKLWNSFTLTAGEIEFEPGEDATFRVGSTQLPALPDGKEYALTVDECGIAIVGKDYRGLMHGFLSLLMKIEPDETALKIRYVTEESNYRLANRMIHICIFPENDLYYIKKLTRLAALCQYTHIVFEFWGMLQYDCLQELAWPHAFPKEAAKELAKECRELGLEAIPMFNQLGHASASRVCYGKHVVLDQNPRLGHLFTPDGWAWNISSERVFSLLKQVRAELYEVFPDSEFIHIGCDEADYISRNPALRQELPGYLARLTHEVETEGRRPMLWMDMLLEKGIFKDCYSSGEKDEVEALRNATAKSSVFVDWQYDCCDVPVPSLLSLKDCGRDVIGAPWYDGDNYCAHIQTVEQNAMFGVMLTTWHTLKEHISSVLGCAQAFGAVTFPWSKFSGSRTETATMLRRVSFEGNTYADCGWAKEQIEV
ncbi:MAG: hypothetical protein E7452_03930 [Ruminococcaceae bacterium]|nr:hypothetical protein [Oscillospiraceae bacterium]